MQRVVGTREFLRVAFGDDVVDYPLGGGAPLVASAAPLPPAEIFARADMIEALQPRNIGLDRFISAWYDTGTQDALHALIAKLGKG